MSRYELVEREKTKKQKKKNETGARFIVWTPSAHETLVTPQRGSGEKDTFFLKVQENLLLIFIEMVLRTGPAVRSIRQLCLKPHL